MMTMSIGEAFYPHDGADAEQLLAVADRRMYRAKQRTRVTAAGGGAGERTGIRNGAIDDMRNWALKLARKFGAVGATVLIGGLLTAAMVRLSPGFDSDERLLDARLDAGSQAAARAEHAANRNVVSFYAHHLAGMLRGDLGESPSLRRPIAELIVDRLPVTAELMAVGVVGGWALAIALALPAVLCRRRFAAQIAETFSTVMLCLPPAAIAVGIFTWGGPVRIIVALVLFPRLFDYCRESAGGRLRASAHFDGAGEGCGSGANFLPSRAAGKRAAISGAGRSVGEHGVRRGDSGGDAVRSAGHRTTGVEGGDGARSSGAGVPDDDDHGGDAVVQYGGGRSDGMKRMRTAAWIVLAAILALSVAAGFVPGASYDEQHREFTNAAPSGRFLLGTDDLGRDRLVRLLCATRISLLLAAAASLGALLLAASVGGAAGYLGGWFDRVTMRAIDLMLSLPWLFLLIAARALLPLNASPEGSLVVTYLLLALLGWAAPARVIRGGCAELPGVGLRAAGEGVGMSGSGGCWCATFCRTCRPVLLAQFWTSIPIFILAEANLGFLGLSASEPFPTWGKLLRELQSPLMLRPEAFAPAAAMAVIAALLQTDHALRRFPQV